MLIFHINLIKVDKRTALFNKRMWLLCKITEDNKIKLRSSLSRLHRISGLGYIRFHNYYPVSGLITMRCNTEQGCIFAQNMIFLPLPLFQNDIFSLGTVKISTFSHLFLLIYFFLDKIKNIHPCLN